jgi:hypothetical protein
MSKKIFVFFAVLIGGGLLGMALDSIMGWVWVPHDSYIVVWGTVSGLFFPIRINE